MKDKIIILVFLIGTFLFAANFGPYKIASLFTETTSEKKLAASKTDSTAIAKN